MQTDVRACPMSSVGYQLLVCFPLSLVKIRSISDRDFGLELPCPLLDPTGPVQ